MDRIQMTGNPELRLLILAPTGKDARLIALALDEAGMEYHVCSGVREVVDAIAAGAGALVVAEEALRDDQRRLERALSSQPPWSDLPILLLTRRRGDAPGSVPILQGLNVTLMERPLSVRALLSGARMALRARARQYESRTFIRDLEQAAATLREGDRLKDEFLAMLAHELRNPLAPIRNSLYMLRLGGNLDAAGSGLLQIMERQAGHLVRLVDDLMEASRITRGKIDLQQAPVDLASALATSIETSRPLIQAAGHHLEVRMPPERVVVRGDFVRLAQVFTNLLNNAAKYTDPGGRIWLTAGVEADEAVVSVRDTGVGISDGMLPRVFDMFMQADRSGRSGSGLGIGLTLVRTLVALHGGTVEARSEGPGRGSEFIVRLPRAAEEAPVEGSRDAGELSVPHRRIVVVDDSRDAADSLAMLLERLGAEVRVAYDGPSALEVVDDFRPAAVFLDIGMPGMDGYEVARRIHQRPELRDTKLIALSGWSRQEQQRRFRPAGFAHHLSKPPDLDALKAVLSN